MLGGTIPRTRKLRRQLIERKVKPRVQERDDEIRRIRRETLEQGLAKAHKEFFDYLKAHHPYLLKDQKGDPMKPGSLRVILYGQRRRTTDLL